MQRVSLKRKLGKFWPKKSKNRKIILLYHSIGNTPWGMAKSAFKEQMDWLADHSRILSLTQLIHAEPSEDIQVALTFDDGYQALFDNVAPILSEKKLNACVYLNTGWIAENSRLRKASVATLGHYPGEHFLNWDEVKQLSQNHWEIASHGINHHNFTHIEDGLIQYELAQSKKHIEYQLNRSCLHFSYPFGQYTKSVKDRVKEAGYQYATAALHGQLSSDSDYMALPRINISKNYLLDDFKNIVLGKWDYLKWFQKIKRL